MLISIAGKRVLYLTLTVCTAFVLQHFIPHDQNNWLPWSALMLSLITLGDTFSHRLIIILLTGFASSLVVFLGGCMAAFIPLLAITLFIITVANFFLKRRYPDYFIPFFIINLFALLTVGTLPTFSENMVRVAFILTGTGIALFFQFIFIRHFTLNECRSWLIITIRNMALLNQDIFSCFLRKEYNDNLYLFERRIHTNKTKCMQSISKARTITEHSAKKMHKEQKRRIDQLITKLDKLYEIMLDYAQLRRRVSDHTVFFLCASELEAIAKEIGRLFSALSRNVFSAIEIDTTPLTEKIRDFEDNYLHVLQVTAREPLVFVLFISSLKSFQEEVAK